MSGEKLWRGEGSQRGVEPAKKKEVMKEKKTENKFNILYKFGFSFATISIIIIFNAYIFICPGHVQL